MKASQPLTPCTVQVMKLLPCLLGNNLQATVTEVKGDQQHRKEAHCSVIIELVNDRPISTALVSPLPPGSPSRTAAEAQCLGQWICPTEILQLRRWQEAHKPQRQGLPVRTTGRVQSRNTVTACRSDLIFQITVTRFLKSPSLSHPTLVYK